MIEITELRKLVFFIIVVDTCNIYKIYFILYKKVAYIFLF